MCYISILHLSYSKLLLCCCWLVCKLLFEQLFEAVFILGKWYVHKLRTLFATTQTHICHYIFRYSEQTFYTWPICMQQISNYTSNEKNSKKTIYAHTKLTVCYSYYYDYYWLEGIFYTKFDLELFRIRCENKFLRITNIAVVVISRLFVNVNEKIRSAQLTTLPSDSFFFLFRLCVAYVQLISFDQHG